MFDLKKFHEFMVQLVIKLGALVRCNYLRKPHPHEDKHLYIRMRSTLKSTIATVHADLSTMGTASTHLVK